MTLEQWLPTLTTWQFSNRTAIKTFQLEPFSTLLFDTTFNFLLQLLRKRSGKATLKDIHMWEKGIRLKDSVYITFIGRYIIDPYPIQKDISVEASRRPVIIFKNSRFIRPWSPEEYKIFLLLAKVTSRYPQKPYLNSIIGFSIHINSSFHG